MRFLVENGCYHLQNLGDVAMLQTTVAPPHEHFPHSRFEVVTDAPELLSQLCPDSVARPLRRRARSVPDQRHSHLRYAFGIARRALGRGMESVRWRNPHEFSPEYRDAIRRADSVVCCGGGLINDWFVRNGVRILRTMEYAQELGKPTAMFGLGLGPVSDKVLRSHARRVLPSLDSLTLREGRRGPAILDSLGVPRSRAQVTGDDAIETAYRRGGLTPGGLIGLNMRVARHAEVPHNAPHAVRQALVEFARRIQSRILPVPVMLRGDDNDEAVVRELIPVEYLAGNGTTPTTPDDLLSRIARCRVVVSGSYHTCVFALAMGIPVVALAQSEYYLDKHQGLSEQFRGAGCVLRMSSRSLREQLVASLQSAWNVSHLLRERLRESAMVQVDLARDAYARFAELLRRRSAFSTRMRPTLPGPMAKVR